MPYLKAKHLRPEYKEIEKQLSKTNRKLVYLGKEIKFHSETNLEDYVTQFFDEIFPELILLKRQHTVRSQRCDLLCCTRSNSQPVIIELKNEEDRYIVSQLIRYRKAILIEQPFAEQIDYSLPVKLIAIAPTFHEDNYTDKDSSKFENDLLFLNFTTENHNSSAKFKLSGNTFDIPYPIFGLPNVTSTVDLNINSLTGFSSNFAYNLPQEYHNDFISLRALFMAQPKVKEMVSGSYRKILYGTGEGENHKKLAEITNTSKGLCLYLWLPTYVKTNIKIPVTRFAFICNENNSALGQSSTVKWILCTKDTIDVRAEYSFAKKECLSSNRHGMSKLCRPNYYLEHVTGASPNTFWLLLYLLKGITPPIDNENLQWWQSIKEQTPNNLGWFIDLAIKTWNFRLNKSAAKQLDLSS